MSQTINPNDAEEIALELATEDCYGLYEIEWALNSAFPGSSNEQRVAAASTAISSLLNQGQIEIFERIGAENEFRRVESERFYAASVLPESWTPSQDITLAIGATEAGNRRYFQRKNLNRAQVPTPRAAWPSSSR